MARPGKDEALGSVDEFIRVLMNSLTPQVRRVLIG